jgi:hypothetical protein
MSDAKAHAEQCEHCRQELYLWGEISRLAPQLHHEWESPSLWPRIEADLVRLLPTRSVVPFWPLSIAAAALVIVGLMLAFPWNSPNPHSRKFLTENALHDVQQAEAAYTQAIAKLSDLAQPGLEVSPSPVAAAYREKLVILDSAISDLKADVAGNRYNAYLQTQLASLYREKQKTLQEWLENAKQD